MVSFIMPFVIINQKRARQKIGVLFFKNRNCIDTSKINPFQRRSPSVDHSFIEYFVLSSYNISIRSTSHMTALLVPYLAPTWTPWRVSLGSSLAHATRRSRNGQNYFQVLHPSYRNTNDTKRKSRRSYAKARNSSPATLTSTTTDPTFKLGRQVRLTITTISPSTQHVVPQNNIRGQPGAEPLVIVHVHRKRAGPGADAPNHGNLTRNGGDCSSRE